MSQLGCDILFLVFSNASNSAMPHENKIIAKGETESENSKQAHETIFYLKRFTSHRATKT